MKHEDQLKIVIASDINYGQLIVEIDCDEEFIALLHQENGADDPKIEFSY
ncbi:hypothetical protein [Pantoea sp. S61]|nr:hypothetical protein [Pantoea sp. S61]